MDSLIVLTSSVNFSFLLIICRLQSNQKILNPDSGNEIKISSDQKLVDPNFDDMKQMVSWIRWLLYKMRLQQAIFMIRIGGFCSVLYGIIPTLLEVNSNMMTLFFLFCSYVF